MSLYWLFVSLGLICFMLIDFLLNIWKRTNNRFQGMGEVDRKVSYFKLLDWYNIAAVQNRRKFPGKSVATSHIDMDIHVETIVSGAIFYDELHSHMMWCLTPKWSIFSSLWSIICAGDNGKTISIKWSSIHSNFSWIIMNSHNDTQSG